jgi:hypothetical protein
MNPSTNPSTILRPLERVGKPAAAAFAAAAVGVVASLLVALAADSAAGATGTCADKQIYPGDDLAAVAEGCGPGSTFYVNDGDYHVDRPIVVNSDDVWSGVYSDDSRPQVRTASARNVFDAWSSNGATIRGIAASGGQGVCKPECGRGFNGGTNLLLQNVRAYDNDNQGVGGQGPGLVIRDSELDHNGTPEYYNDPIYASAAGVKSVNSFAVYNSYIHDNAWNGVWCDLECDRFEVHDSRLVANGKSGVFYEVSAGGAVVEGNRFARNGQIGASINRPGAGLSVKSSRNLDAYGNTFAGNNINHGFRAGEDKRPPDLGNISFHDNTMNGDALRGCVITGVSCKNND